MNYLPESKLNELRGKAMVSAITGDEALAVLNHLTVLESKLDDLDLEDFFGTEGWRAFFGLPE